MVFPLKYAVPRDSLNSLPGDRHANRPGKARPSLARQETPVMWVLIVLSVASYGYNQAAIPGYHSEAACDAAGRVWTAKAPSSFTRFKTSFVCIPGPAQQTSKSE
jgi:hypothetical protein